MAERSSTNSAPHSWCSGRPLYRDPGCGGGVRQAEIPGTPACRRHRATVGAKPSTRRSQIAAGNIVWCPAGRPEGFGIRAEFYEPYRPDLAHLRARNIDLSKIAALDTDAKQAIDGFITNKGGRLDDYLYLPLKGKNKDIVMALSPKDGLPVGFISISPWIEDYRESTPAPSTPPAPTAPQPPTSPSGNPSSTTKSANSSGQSRQQFPLSLFYACFLNRAVGDYKTIQ